MLKTLQTANETDRAHEIESLIRELLVIRGEMTESGTGTSFAISALHPGHRESALNLLHYLALRRHDLRPLQVRLAGLGLSSLGRAESHVLATVDAVLAALHRLAGRTWSGPDDVVAIGAGDRILAEHANRLLGPASHGRDTRIMVTMPSEAADDYTLVHDLLKQGMNCMRVNCAHDDRSQWLRMIEHLRRAERALGLKCRVLMDLGGPKLRTGPLEPGPAVIKIKPTRDRCGHVVAAARVWLTGTDAPVPPPTDADASLPVTPEWLGTLHIGDRVTFKDARDFRRSMRIVDTTEAGCWAELTKTAYVLSGLALRRASRLSDEPEDATVGEIPRVENALDVHEGDAVTVTRGTAPGRAATFDGKGRVLTPASIGCTIDRVFDDVRTGESIWFDDGKIGGVIDSVTSQRIDVRVTHAPVQGAALRGNKGINLPETHLHVAALTEKDVLDMAFVAEHADIVGLSFASSAEDVELLQEQLARQGPRQPAIVLKIETRRGFEHLPDMLLTAMKMPSCGVMIARGDLAVECGFERLAEVQEEMLWVCEAAHVPVIWATQVLESLAKQGLPSRAEITDAAMGHRAECVMLNKGPHVRSAVRVLDDILRRMEAHQTKKRSMLRELRLAHGHINGVANHASRSA